MSRRRYLIIGNGAAGLSAAEVIRRRDQTGEITIMTDEPYLFYSRPGIAYYALGEISEKQIITRSRSFYNEHRFDLRFGRVTELDISRQLAHLDDGASISYDACLLATGSTATPPPFPGGGLNGVLTFDTLDDAKKVVHCGRRARSAVVVGGGITAMELAEALHRQRAHTHLLQRKDRIWPRLFDEQESAIIERQILNEGIDIQYRTEIEEVLGKRGMVAGVRLKDGTEIPCQVVGVAIGVRPNMALVKDHDIKQDRGVIVNAFMQSTCPTLFAAGDVAQVYDRWTQKHLLDVLWPSAINEGRAAGHNMVDVAVGKPPTFPYQKGSPFNAALLFGVHLTVIGRVGDSTGETDEQNIQYLSRGSSFVWTLPLSTGYHSAWDAHAQNSVRIVLSDHRIVGALLLGNQKLADPLRQMIEYGVNVQDFAPRALESDADLPQAILSIWGAWKKASDAARAAEYSVS